MSNVLIWRPRYAIWIALQEDGESAGDLAGRLGWDPSKLSRIITGERKKVDIEEWQAIAKAQNRELSHYLEPPKRDMGVYLNSLHTVVYAHAA